MAGFVFPGSATLRYHGQPGAAAAVTSPPPPPRDPRASELDGRGRRPGYDAQGVRVPVERRPSMRVRHWAASPFSNAGVKVLEKGSVCQLLAGNPENI